ncbi:MAG: hypothetical protein AAFV53_02155 [Myxococcota bacterium]
MSKSFVKLAKAAKAADTVKNIKKIRATKGGTFGAFSLMVDPKKNVMLLSVTRGRSDPKGGAAKKNAANPAAMDALGLSQKACKTARGLVQGSQKDELTFWVRQGTASPKMIVAAFKEMARNYKLKELKGAVVKKYDKEAFNNRLSAGSADATMTATTVGKSIARTFATRFKEGWSNPFSRNRNTLTVLEDDLTERIGQNLDKQKARLEAIEDMFDPAEAAAEAQAEIDNLLGQLDHAGSEAERKARAQELMDFLKEGPSVDALDPDSVKAIQDIAQQTLYPQTPQVQEQVQQKTEEAQTTGDTLRDKQLAALLEKAKTMPGMGTTDLLGFIDILEASMPLAGFKETLTPVLDDADMWLYFQFLTISPRPPGDLLAKLNGLKAPITGSKQAEDFREILQEKIDRIKAKKSRDDDDPSSSSSIPSSSSSPPTSEEDPKPPRQTTDEGPQEPAEPKAWTAERVQETRRRFKDRFRQVEQTVRELKKRVDNHQTSKINVDMTRSEVADALKALEAQMEDARTMLKTELKAGG